MIKISPSILSADFLDLGKEITALEAAQADFIHIDVMDGHFVPNLTIGLPIIAAIKRVATKPLDVHLMVTNPEPYLDTYVDSGADLVTIHAESVIHLERAIKHIKSRGAKAGVALNPSTHEDALKYVIGDVDLVLIMSVNPGFGGQRFLPSALTKIAAVTTMLAAANNPNCLISVDGGINDENAKDCLGAGASCLVAGSYIFSAQNYGDAIARLRGASQR